MLAGRAGELARLDRLLTEARAGRSGALVVKRAATLVDVGRVAAFLASDHARTLTSTQVNISCGALVD